MKVFISWSKPVARQVAEALRDWLPFVFNQLDLWMSSADLEAGVRWGQQLAARLAGTSFGIVCLTPENLDEPWIYFEAGALSKEVTDPAQRLIPLLFHVSLTDVRRPLQQFQAVSADRNGILSLVTSIHSVLGPTLIDETRMRRAFDKWWPDLETQLNAITIPEGQAPRPEFNQEDAMRELLLTVREISRRPEHTTATALDSSTVGSVWKQTLAEMGDMTADFASRADSVISVGPNRLLVLFRKSYTQAQQYCERREKRQMLEQAFSRNAGRKVEIEFGILPDEV